MKSKVKIKTLATLIMGALMLVLCSLVFTGCPVEPEPDPGSDPSVSSTPTASVTSVAKTTLAAQKSVEFTLTSENDGVWKVYTTPGGAALAPVTATFEVSTKILTLTATGDDLQPGTYYVSVTETDKTESGRLPLTVSAYEAPTSDTPTADIAIAEKDTTSQKTVEFTLTSENDGVWKVYDAATGDTELTDVTAEFDAETLTLTLIADGADLEPRIYYVSVSEDNKLPSGRLALTVINPLTVADLARYIKRAEVALGDLSTVDDDITLPTSYDGLVNVSWTTTNSALSINDGTGTVSQPGSGVATGTLTGTFVAVKNLSVTTTNIWSNVRVMPSDAEPEDYLVLDLGFDGGVFKNLAPSGDYYEPTLEDDAQAYTITGMGDAIDFNGGYVDLGPKVGALLRKDEWTIEFYVYIDPAINTDADLQSTFFSFANDGNINTDTADNWRGTATFVGHSASFGIANRGRANLGPPTNGTENNSGNDSRAWFGNSGGLNNNYRGEWVHVIVNAYNDKVNMWRIKTDPGTGTQGDHSAYMSDNTRNTYATRLRTGEANDIFGSGDPELEDLRFGYIGKSVYEGISPLNDLDRRLPANTKIYGFKAYSKALVPLTTTVAASCQMWVVNPALLTARRAVMTNLNITEKFYYTVDFAGHSSHIINGLPSRILAASNKTITKPTPDPVRTGYKFIGWYKTDNDVPVTNDEWVFGSSGDTVTTNLVLYAGWQEAKYTVDFDKNTTDTVTNMPSAQVDVPHGTTISEPSQVPVRSGFFFGGWYKNAAATTAWNFTTDAVEDETTLYARWIVPTEEVASKIRKAVVALGDLSTVGGNISLPQSDTFVTVAWASTNTGLVDINGTVNQPSGAPETATLTGTFTSVNDPSVSDTETWTVRVMHSDAAWSDYLNVHYVASASGLENTAYSGTYYVPTLEESAATATGLGGDGTVDAELANTVETGQPNKAPEGDVNNYGYYVKLGSDGYIDLGPTVGALLRKPEWTVEFYIRLQADAGTMLSFANDQPITDATNSPWRGTLLFHNSGMFFKALRNGAVGYNTGSQDGATSEAVSTGNSGGISAARRNQWVHLALVKRTDGTVRIMRNGVRAQNNFTNTGYNRITNEAIFGSGDPTVDDLRFGYLGRSVLANSGVTGNTADGTPNAWIYGFKVYSKAAPLDGSDNWNDNLGDISTPGTLWGDKKIMNDAFGFNDNN